MGLNSSIFLGNIASHSIVLGIVVPFAPEPEMIEVVPEPVI